ncbi:MAG: hypothetical protein AAF125_27420 [Chloroflexota bacterium]
MSVGLLSGDLPGYPNPLADTLAQDYLPVFGRYYNSGLNITHYQRLPDNPQEMVTFGGEVTLMHWHLAPGVTVQPCTTLTLSSWWRAASEPPRANTDLTWSVVSETGETISRVDRLLGDHVGDHSGGWMMPDLHYDERTLDVPCDLAAGSYPIGLSAFVWDDNIDEIETYDAVLPDGTSTGGFFYLTNLFVE